MSTNNRTDDKLDKIQEDISDIKIIMERNTTSLEYHIKRTNILEGKVAPLEKHADMMNGALKLLGVCAAIAAIIEAMHMVLK